MLMEYHVITAGYSGLMARFDEVGQFVEWTPSIRKASHFATRQDSAEAIRSMCRAELEGAVRRGEAQRVLDEETDEVVYLDQAGRPIRPRMRANASESASLWNGAGPGRQETVRQSARNAFADAKRQNTTRATAAMITAGVGPDDYTTSASQRARALANFARRA